MKKGLFIFLATILLATSCNSTDKKPNNQSEKNETETSNIEQSSAPNVSSGEVQPTSAGNPSTVASSSIDSQVSTVSQTSINSQTSTTQPIEHHHIWTAASYIWNSDHSQCTAERTCIVPPVHTESETVQSNYVVYTQPTCESNGLGLFTAVFTNENFTEQQYLYQIPANGHNYDEPTYEWNEDYSQCTARRVCLTDSNHVETETVSSQVVHIEAPKCETGGVDAFKASFANKGFSDQFHYYDIEQIGHDFGEVSYTWSNDYLQCTAKRVCRNDSSHIEEETVDCDVQVLTALDCEVDGHEIHTASFVNPVFETQYRDLELTHTGHTFGAPTYTWNEDHSQCTAERVCQNNSNHFERETVDSVSRYIDEPTYINTGVREFTAEFTNSAFSKQVFNENVPTLEYLIYEQRHNSCSVAGIVEDYNGPVTIPSTHNGLPVERINNNAFRWSTISSVTIPSSVTTIESYAFADCNNLESVTLSEGLRSIEGYAFEDCKALKTLNLPSSVQMIGERAFDYAGLTSIVLPNSLTDVGAYAFYSCQFDELALPSSLVNVTEYSFSGVRIKNLRIPNNYTKAIVQNIISNSYIVAVLIEEDNPNFFIESGILFEKTTNNIVFVAKNLEGEFVVPSFMKSIPESFLSDCGFITSVVIHDNVESIGSYAFANCRSLTEVHIPDSVTTLGQNIFYNCSSLNIVTLPSGITSIPNSMFSGCVHLTAITLPDTITSIGNYAFRNCSIDLNLTLPTSIETIGDYAFEYTGITQVNLPNLTFLGVEAFSECRKLETVSLGNTITTIPNRAFYYCSSLSSVVLPENLLAISSDAFAGCTLLTEIDLPSSLTTIGFDAFRWAGLTSIFIPKNVSSLASLGLNEQTTISISDENDYYAAIDDIIYSKDIKTLVYTNKQDKDFEVIEGVTKIAEKAIPVQLESISLPSTLVAIEDNAFYGSTLQSIVFPESLKTIGYNVFGENSYIKQLVFPKNFESLGGNNYFRVLESIKLSDLMDGSILNQISDYHYPGKSTHKIPQVEIYDTNPNLEMVSGILYSESLDTIAWASPSLEGEITIRESVETILQYAFADCTKITKAIIPDNVTEIYSYAFAYCSSLKEAILPTQIRYSVCNGLFCWCPLESITLPDNIPLDNLCSTYTLDENGCCYPRTLKNVIVRDSYLYYTKRGKAIYESLHYGEETLIFVERDFFGEFVVPETTTSIGEAAFADCPGLTSVVFGSNVKMIDDRAFNNCVSLESVEMNEGLEAIYYQPFVNCKSLTSIVFPNSIEYTYDDDYLFVDCDALEYVKIADSMYFLMSFYGPYNWSKNLETIELYDTNTKYKSVDGVIYTADFSSLIFIPKSTTTLVLPVEMNYFPSKTIGAHEGPIDLVITNPNIQMSNLPINIRSLTIPDEMNILDYTGKELEFSVTISNQLVVSETNQYVTMVDDVLYTKDMSTILRVSGNKVGNFIIPDTVETIASYAFADCTKITSIEFNDGLETIGQGAFEGCSGLTNVVLPSSLKIIRSVAFKDCTSLVHITIPDSTIGYIGVATFENCTNLVEFNVPLGALYIDSYAFAGCSSLAAITFQEVFNGIGRGAFFNCTSLREIVIPEGTEELLSLAFMGCTSLEEIYIPSSIDSDFTIPFLANELVITYGGTYEDWLSHIDYLELTEGVIEYIMENIGYMPNNDFILHCSDGSYSYNYASNTYTPLEN